jgi:tRNA(fMet)-specific endonuclease VapC
MASLKAQGTPREDNDIWIAACALQHDLPLMTHNPRHFDHIKGLRLIHEPDAES